jgi:Domain of unknown function (DUF4124)
MEAMVKVMFVVMLFAASQAHGEVYTWEDSRGAQHYTNRKDDIPVRFRSDAKSLDYDREPRAGGLPRLENTAPFPDQPEQVGTETKRLSAPARIKKRSRLPNRE